MTDMTDPDAEIEVDPGMLLRAGTTGWVYRVERVSDDTVFVDGSRGPLAVDREELESHIQQGLVTVEAWR